MLTLYLSVYSGLAGQYTFTSSKADDIAILWVGNYAYSGWTRDNADSVAVDDFGVAFQFELDKGSYTPIRLMYGNGGGLSGATIQILDPYGNVVLSSDSPASPYIVQYGCDDSDLAPDFKPFQKEI